MHVRHYCQINICLTTVKFSFETNAHELFNFHFLLFFTFWVAMVLSLPHLSTSSQGAESIKLSVWHGCSGTPDGIEAVRLASMSYFFGAMRTVESAVGKITLLRVIPTVIYFVIVYDISCGSVCGIYIYVCMYVYMF
jgi:hypothetical protein